MKHIIGKVYDLTQENMNKLIEQLEAREKEIVELKLAYQALQSGFTIEAKDKFIQSLITELDAKCNEIEELLAALREIAKDFGTDFCDGNTMIAYEAIDKHGGKVADK